MGGEKEGKILPPGDYGPNFISLCADKSERSSRMIIIYIIYIVHTIAHDYVSYHVNVEENIYIMSGDYGPIFISLC